MSDILERIKRIKEQIHHSVEKSGRKIEDVNIVAVSKMHPASKIVEAFEAGLSVFGENRVQEAEDKINSLSNLNVSWHLVGHLQSNKVKKALPLFKLIHSVDRAKLIRTINDEALKQEKIVDILLQVNIGEEESKSGISVQDFESLLEALNNTRNLRCHGLMTVPPYYDDPNDVRPFFQSLRELAEKYQDDFLPQGAKLELSMGMTHDFPVAIEEGATLVRIGTAIFGTRNYQQ